MFRIEFFITCRFASRGHGFCCFPACREEASSRCGWIYQARGGDRHRRSELFPERAALLEHIRGGVESNIQKRGGGIAKIFNHAKAAWLRLNDKAPQTWDFFWLGLAGLLIFPPIRKKLGPNLRALICGSAPLARETQLFFMMLGIRVLQVYGLTETTAICTMDDPDRVEPGRVGPAIPGIEMKIGDTSEIVVRGPNVFPGYWRRPEQTAAVLLDGWFHTGDQGDVDSSGNWRITGRLKNLIILNSGHNIAPEPIEEELFRAVPGAQHVMLVGNGRSFLAAIITGTAAAALIDSQLERVNAPLPHYRKIRRYHISEELFTIENGLLTANGKLRRTQSPRASLRRLSGCMPNQIK